MRSPPGLKAKGDVFTLYMDDVVEVVHEPSHLLGHLLFCLAMA